jgi:hypothetical protein
VEVASLEAVGRRLVAIEMLRHARNLACSLWFCDMDALVCGCWARSDEGDNGEEG